MSRIYADLVVGDVLILDFLDKIYVLTSIDIRESIPRNRQSATLVWTELFPNVGGAYENLEIPHASIPMGWNILKNAQ